MYHFKIKRSNVLPGLPFLTCLKEQLQLCHVCSAPDEDSWTLAITLPGIIVQEIHFYMFNLLELLSLCWHKVQWILEKRKMKTVTKTLYKTVNKR